METAEVDASSSAVSGNKEKVRTGMCWDEDTAVAAADRVCSVESAAAATARWGRTRCVTKGRSMVAIGSAAQGQSCTQQLVLATSKACCGGAALMVKPVKVGEGQRRTDE